MAAKTDTPPKQYRSKFFRVAVEGATTDGRTIERQWLIDAAETYDRNTYGARVWLEHFRSLLPDGPFRAYGDVVALKTDEIEIAGKKKLALFAQIEPTADLIALNKARQKIYTSIEIKPKFADTGRAYLDGIAVTDTPASLGTEMLTFSAQHPDASPLKARKQNPDNLFSEAIEVALEFEEVTDNEHRLAGLFSRVMDALGKGRAKAAQDDRQFAELADAVEALANHARDQGETFAQEQAARHDLARQLAQLTTHFDDLVKRLSETDNNPTRRPPVTGGDGRAVTDC
ncbi:GPO family capsid scaffolding protein [Pseudomonas entomophila]|uniref:GPO family capsid scaffolding protein n=1 Tax=Pseudomonas entomophila TaxID=312306 RepID=UPI0015E2BAB5|nr:GPO family capsid scaffolding protein [Pseudomonas entomophila]MBA1187574.1 GPO family capsid scaffolding protein [Pseudomonas entomophila]